MAVGDFDYHSLAASQLLLGPILFCEYGLSSTTPFSLR